MATNHDRPSRLRFSDGMEFDLSGDLRVVHRRDGWYVVGRGMLIPVADREEGDRMVAEMNNQEATAMRYGPDDKLWVVVDPKSHSRLDDLMFQASLRDLELQFKGGLQIDENPTLFTDEQEAKYEACGRMTAMRASQAILRAGRENPDNRIDRVEIYGQDGTLVFEADIPREGD